MIANETMSANFVTLLIALACCVAHRNTTYTEAEVLNTSGFFNRDYLRVHS